MDFGGLAGGVQFDPGAVLQLLETFDAEYTAARRAVHDLLYCLAQLGLGQMAVHEKQGIEIAIVIHILLDVAGRIAAAGGNACKVFFGKGVPVGT